MRTKIWWRIILGWYLIANVYMNFGYILVFRGWPQFFGNLTGIVLCGALGTWLIVSGYTGKTKGVA